MAKVLKNGLLSGRVGNLVYFVINGKQYVRTWAKPSDPGTPAQRRQRAKMRTCAKFFSPLKNVIRIGYQGGSKDLEQFNECTRYHMENAMEDVTESGSTDFTFRVIPQKVKLSRGHIPWPEVISCERTGRELSLTWDPDLGIQSNQRNDSLVVVGYIPGKKPFVDFHSGTRAAGAATVILPNDFSSPAYVWGFYLSVSRSSRGDKWNVSDSVYLGNL